MFLLKKRNNLDFFSFKNYIQHVPCESIPGNEVISSQNASHYTQNSISLCLKGWILGGQPWVWSDTHKVLWNNKLPISLERVEWFCSFFACMYLFKCFTEATKICYFELVLPGMDSQPIRLPDVLNLKNLKTIWGIQYIRIRIPTHLKIN